MRLSTIIATPHTRIESDALADFVSNETRYFLTFAFEDEGKWFHLNSDGTSWFVLSTGYNRRDTVISAGRNTARALRALFAECLPDGDGWRSLPKIPSEGMEGRLPDEFRFLLGFAQNHNPEDPYKQPLAAARTKAGLPATFSRDMISSGVIPKFLYAVWGVLSVGHSVGGTK